MRKNSILSFFTISSMSSVVQPVVFKGCPDNNVAVLRAAMNSSTNPVSIYKVSTTMPQETELRAYNRSGRCNKKLSGKRIRIEYKRWIFI